MEYHLYWKLKSFRFKFFGDEKYGIFEPKSWWKYDIYWLLKSSCFNLFGNGKCGLFFSQKIDGKTIFTVLKSSCFNIFGIGKYGPFLSQKNDGKMIFTDYWKSLVLNFSVMRNTVFFESTLWLKNDISYFQLFGFGKYGLFFSQNVDGEMIFTWYFWAFYDIPGPGKYGFSRSVVYSCAYGNIWEIYLCCCPT